MDTAEYERLCDRIRRANAGTIVPTEAQLFLVQELEGNVLRIDPLASDLFEIILTIDGELREDFDHESVRDVLQAFVNGVRAGQEMCGQSPTWTPIIVEVAGARRVWIELSDDSKLELFQF